MSARRPGRTTRRREGFDPALHQAGGQWCPHPELPANQVVEVLRAGYTLNERLVRPAMVGKTTGRS
ncbi:MAG: nucleotide exchange factor GrpE [Gammaproteobacteria bacterium]|nr:nucleotide exchange factor GrpE [Gammaproteobacteria bacterium]